MAADSILGHAVKPHEQVLGAESLSVATGAAFVCHSSCLTEGFTATKVYDSCVHLASRLFVIIRAFSTLSWILLQMSVSQNFAMSWSNCSSFRS